MYLTLLHDFAKGRATGGSGRRAAAPGPAGRVPKGTPPGYLLTTHSNTPDLTSPEGFRQSFRCHISTGSWRVTMPVAMAGCPVGYAHDQA